MTIVTEPGVVKIEAHELLVHKEIDLAFSTAFDGRRISEMAAA
jgi:hypothetical protein